MKGSSTTRLGRPIFSKGCHACRSMKVKCDERKPECTRCFRAGRRCPGYRDNSDVVFRSMNAAAAARSSRSQKKGNPATDSPKNVTNMSSIRRVIAPYDWEQLALNHFFDSYIHVSISEPGYLDFLPDLFTKEQGAAHLKSSLMATSLASLGNSSGLDRLHYRSQKLYGEALKFVNAALRDPLEAKKDSTLTAIVLLQKYETINGITRYGAPNDPHEKGLAELLRLRGPEQMSSAIGRDLFRIVQSKLQPAETDGSPPNISRVDTDLENMSASPPGLQLYRLLQGVSESCHRIRYYLPRIPEGTSDIVELREALEDASSLYYRMIEWPSCVPERWRYKADAVTPTKISPRHGPTYPTKTYAFWDLNYGAMWIGYWRSHVYLFQKIIQGLDCLPQSAESSLLSRDDLRTGLLATVDDICASVPYMVGDIGEDGQPKVKSRSKGLGSLLLLIALDAANSLDDLPQVQRRYILRQLYYIGHSQGIKMALRTRDEWLEKHKGNPDLEFLESLA